MFLLNVVSKIRQLFWIKAGNQAIVGIRNRPHLPLAGRRYGFTLFRWSDTYR